MIISKKPVSFLATSNPSAAEVFYRDVLGLVHIETSPYAIVLDDGGVMLRVQIVSDLTPAPHTVHGWEVTDINAQVTELVAKRVELLMFDQLDQDALGVWTTPEGHKIAWFKDPCGNILSFTQYNHPE